MLLLHIKLKPGSFQNKVCSCDSLGCWTIKVNAKAIDGQANEALILYLSDILQIAKSHMTIVKGFTSSFKTIQVKGLEEKAVLERLRNML